MGLNTSLTRKDFLASALGIAGVAALPAELRAAVLQKTVGETEIEAMERAIGFPLTPAQRKALVAGSASLRNGYLTVQKMNLGNEIAMPMPFVPMGRQQKEGKSVSVKLGRAVESKLPTKDEDIAFLPVSELSRFIKSGELSPVRLTEIYLSRLMRYGGPLLNVITLCDSLAREQAKRAEAEIRAGKYRGPLHGIPYVIKDLFDSKGIRTTWGAEPFKNRIAESDADVIQMLADAGAILCAKTSVGALAMDDHWFNGKTKNPWNPKVGSSGSSAGSASCMAAGLAAFTIGTETLGSIMSPSHRCRVTGLRPTFGRVSRKGCMALSWTMDKVGPICRTAEDCALVLAAICGKREGDLATVDRPFRFQSDLDLRKLKIAYLSDDAGLDEDDSGGGPDDVIKLLRSMGCDPKPVKFARVPEGIDMVLSVEAAAAFDAITRDGRVDTIPSSLWPGIFRESQFATGVGYVNAQRARVLTMAQIETDFADFDVVIASDRGSYLLFNTNLTGHPQLYVPFGTDSKGVARGVSLIGRLYDEGTILAVGSQIQRKTGHWKLRPNLSAVL